MLHGVIDIGSNTIRLSVYQVADGKITRLLHKKESVGLASYIKDGVMSARGIDKACAVLREYKEILENFSITELHVFGTASLRNIYNTVEAVEEIRCRTGLRVDVISGRKEAIFDFVGATRSVGLSDGLLIDVGGGSSELVVYREKKIVEVCSIPIGALNLYTEYVKGLFPTDKEKKTIRKRVVTELARYPSILGTYPVICGVGGTVRALLGLTNEYMGREETCREMTVRELKQAVKRLDGSDKERLDIIMETAPDRVRTMITGIVLWETLLKVFGAETVLVSTSGVREGYLYCKVVEAWDDV
ncbi:MAG: phosphatase [Selenomonadales bacterium]|nr:phosphatase [Selenomonadales bacterium]